MQGEGERDKKIEKSTYLEIRLQPPEVRALRHDRDAPLHSPAQRDLPHVRLVGLRYSYEVRVVEEQRVALSCITLRVRIDIDVEE